MIFVSWKLTSAVLLGMSLLMFIVYAVKFRHDRETLVDFLEKDDK